MRTLSSEHISFILTILLLIHITHWPLYESYTHKSPTVQEDALRYLSQFGYLTGTNDEQTALKKPLLYRQALKRFQSYFHLNVSGRLDPPTIRLMQRPRCGNQDPVWHSANPSSSVSSSSASSHTLHLHRVRRFLIEDKEKRWNNSQPISYRIKSYPTLGDIPRGKVHQILRTAFNMWSRVANISFSEKSYPDEADIVIEFGRGHHGDSIPFDGPGKVLAHAFYPNPLAGYSRAGDMHFDDEEIWTPDVPNGKDLLAVAVHELGHSLGLGHSNVESAIMYPYYTAQSDVLLSADDEAGIVELYGKPDRMKKFPDDPQIPDVNPTRPAPSLTTIATKPTVDYCNVSIDAIIEMRGLELQVFSSRWVWRIVWSRTPTNWYSYEFRDGPADYWYYFPVLPRNLGHIDTALEGERGVIWMFRGKRFWVMQSNTVLHPYMPNEGLPLTVLGLPEELEKVDTMFYWDPYQDRSPRNKSKLQIFIFAGDLFWEFFEDPHSRNSFGRVGAAPNYPRKIKDVWKGLPTPIDAAFTRHNGETYFFQGNQYYSFNSLRMEVRPGYPQPSRLPWLGCAHSHEQRVREPMFQQPLKARRLMEHPGANNIGLPSAVMPSGGKVDHFLWALVIAVVLYITS